MKQGNKGLLACQEASEITDRKNYLIISTQTQIVFIYVCDQIYCLDQETCFQKNVEMLSLEHASKNTMNLEIKLPLDNNSNSEDLLEHFKCKRYFLWQMYSRKTPVSS